MTWFTVLKVLLIITAWAARNASRHDIEKGVLHELEVLQGVRTREAARVRTRILDGSVPADPDDPYRRD